jgi:hypothetical protein
MIARWRRIGANHRDGDRNDESDGSPEGEQAEVEAWSAVADARCVFFPFRMTAYSKKCGTKRDWLLITRERSSRIPIPQQESSTI